MLQSNRIFEEMNFGALSTLVERLVERTLNSGDVLFRVGDIGERTIPRMLREIRGDVVKVQCSGRHLYVVKSGELACLSRRNEEVAVLRTGLLACRCRASHCHCQAALSIRGLVAACLRFPSRSAPSLASVTVRFYLRGAGCYPKARARAHGSQLCACKNNAAGLIPNARFASVQPGFCRCLRSKRPFYTS